MIDKNTMMFYSVAQKPGNFGATLYNAAFKEMGINAAYKPLSLPLDYDFNTFLETMRAINTFGISVSMPFKKRAFDVVFRSGDAENAIGNINTLVFCELPRALGHNTDYLGFAQACWHWLRSDKFAVIYGRGAVADSIAYVLDSFGMNVHKISSRESPADMVGDIFINASPVGMPHVPDTVFTEENMQDYEYIFDVVVSPERTNLIKIAEKLGKQYVRGGEMCLEQLCKQFEVYIGKDAPRDLFQKILKEKGYVG